MAPRPTNPNPPPFTTKGEEKIALLLNSLVIWLDRQFAGAGKAPDGWSKWLAPVGASLMLKTNLEQGTGTTRGGKTMSLPLSCREGKVCVGGQDRPTAIGDNDAI